MYYTLKNGMTLTEESDISILLKLLEIEPHKSINFLCIST